MNSTAANFSGGALGVLSALVLVVLLGVAPAVAQNVDLRQLLDRIDRLERDIRTLNVQLARGGKAPLPAPGVGVAPAVGATVARTDARLGAFDEELRALTGLAETLSHRVDLVDDRLNKLVGDVDFRLGALERAQAAARAAQPATPGAPRISAAPSTPSVTRARPDSGQGFATQPQSLGTIPQSDLGRLAVPPGAQPPAAPPAAAAIPVLPPGTPKEQYDFAVRLLFEQEYDQAEAVLRAFLGAHPNDALASNAQYWLGETYYVRQDFATAAKVFTEGYKKYKDGAKAADSLLKLSMSLASSEKPEAACFTLAELEKVFPGAQRHIKDQAARQRKRNGCQ